MKVESLLDLIDQATQMLLDRSKPEQDLIYHICKMDNEDRAAIMFAYKAIHNDKSP